MAGAPRRLRRPRRPALPAPPRPRPRPPQPPAGNGADSQRLAGRPPRRRRRGGRPPAIQGSARGGRITKADVLAAGNGTLPHRRRPPSRARPAASAADQGRRRRAGPLHGPEPLDPDRHLVPHADRHHARRAAQAAQERRAKVSFTHLIAYAIASVATEEMPVMAHHFEEIDGKPYRHDDGAVNLGLAVDVEKKDGSRTLMVPVIRDAGRMSFAAVPGRLQRAGGEGADQHADRRRPHRRQRHAHQPRRDRHDRLGAAADGRPGHDRRHRLDRLSGRAGADRAR